MMWLSVWPGLPRLWWRGHGSALALAVSFSALLNLALVATFIWPGALAGWPLTALWLGVATFWSVSAWNSHQWIKSVVGLPKCEQLDELFTLAQAEYLRGHWPEAETGLRKLLTLNPADAEAHLVLATLLRRTNRFAEAHQQLAGLEQLEAAAKWRLEIAAERRQLNRTTNQQAA